MLTKRRLDRRRPPPPRPGPDTLGGRIHLARKRKRLSLQSVGQACGVSPQAVGQWEHNEARPAIDRLTRLAEILETEVEALLGQSDKTITELADRADRVAAQLMESLPPIAAANQVRQRFAKQLVNVGEISERDWTLATTDLCELPDYYIWQLPERLFDYVKSPKAVKIMRITQDTMAPALQPFDYLLIDAGVREIIGGRGIFCMTDGLTQLIRRVELLSGNGAVYRLHADNDKVSDRNVAADQLRVLGRVIGRVSLFF
jgi:transcriptional regulator with XRE-family HTH domain